MSFGFGEMGMVKEKKTLLLSKSIYIIHKERERECV